jgi:hypothetical protein
LLHKIIVHQVMFAPNGRVALLSSGVGRVAWSLVPPL